MKTTTLLAFSLILASAGAAVAAVHTQDVEYKSGDTALKGYLAYDDATKDKRPGVLVVHEWWGHNEHARDRARRLAEAGYVAFALDMYGAGKVATHPKDAGAFMNEVMKAPDVMAARFNAALDYLKKQPQVDTARIGAIGFCFGGSVSLTMARAGADLKAIGTFHAGLKPVAGPAEKGKFKPALLVQTGGSDPMIPKAQVDAFEAEMKAADVSLSLKTYPAAQHAFTNPAADKAGVEGLKYNAEADKASWAELIAFFKKAL